VYTNDSFERFEQPLVLILHCFEDCGSFSRAAARAEVQAQILQWGKVEGDHDVDEADIRVRLASAAIFAQLAQASGRHGPRVA